MKVIECRDIRNILKPGDILVVTTNRIIKKNGELVMGKGIAKIANDLTGGILARKLARKIIESGNIPHIGLIINGITFVSFPTKNHWKEDSSLALINNSCRLISKLADENKWEKVYLSYPGIDNGNLSEEEVYDLINELLDDRFIVFKKEKRRWFS